MRKKIKSDIIETSDIDRLPENTFCYILKYKKPPPYYQGAPCRKDFPKKINV